MEMVHRLTSILRISEVGGRDPSLNTSLINENKVKYTHNECDNQCQKFFIIILSINLDYFIRVT